MRCFCTAYSHFKARFGAINSIRDRIDVGALFVEKIEIHFRWFHFILIEAWNAFENELLFLVHKSYHQSYHQVLLPHHTEDYIASVIESSAKYIPNEFPVYYLSIRLNAFVLYWKKEKRMIVSGVAQSHHWAVHLFISCCRRYFDTSRACL